MADAPLNPADLLSPRTVKPAVDTVSDLPADADDGDTRWVGPDLHQQAVMIEAGQEPPAWAGMYAVHAGQWLKLVAEPMEFIPILNVICPACQQDTLLSHGKYMAHFDGVSAGCANSGQEATTDVAE